jgi:predicted transcriptional regulator
MSDWFEFYKRYGVDLNIRSGKNRGTECFSCSENKMFIEPENGLYVCKLCGHKGNNITFIRRLHKLLSKRKKNPLIIKLANLKKIPSASLKEFGVVQSGTEVFIPVWGPNGKLIGLRPFDFKSNKINNVIGQSTKPNFWLTGNKGNPYYLFEADFDALAFLIMAKKKGLKHNVIAFPGTSFKQEWVEYLKAKKTIWCFDHDELKGKAPNTFYPGEKGVERACEIMAGQTANFKWLNWGDKNYSRPTDVRDLFISCKNNSTRFFNKIDEITQNYNKEEKEETQDSPITPMKITSFEELCGEFSKSIQFNPTLKRTLAVSCATVLSSKTKGDAIWMFIVGPASSGKTTILDAFSGCVDQTIHRSTLTKTSLISGRNIEEDNDPSILPRLNCKCLVIKDLTMLLTANASAQEETFGTLRDAYDSSISVQYGNGVVRNYSNLRFSWLSGVTDIIQSFNKSDAGERFLRVDIIDPEFDEGLQIRKALQNLSKDSHTDHLRAATLGFIEHVWKTEYEENLPDLMPQDITRLESLAQVISFMRTKVKKSREGDIEYRVRKEVGTRVAKQLGKLIQMLCITLQKDSLSKEEFDEYILKVALDTCTSIQTEISVQLMKFHKSIDGCTVEMLSDKLQLGKSTVQNHLNNMQEVGFVDFLKKDNQSGSRGRNFRLWRPTKKFQDLWTQSGLNDFDYTINFNTIDRAKKKSRKKVKVKK